VSARAVLALAGLADAAVRGLHPVSVRQQRSAAEDVDAALVTDTEKRRWLIRAPRTIAAGARLDAEGRLLGMVAGRLPFGVPEVVGTAALPGGGRAVVSRHLPGTPLDLSNLPSGSPLPAELGRCIAALHDVPPSVLEDAGMPVYAAEEYRLRRLAEVDRAASTGHVPAALLSRWEHALEEAGAWRFSPCTVHGDLAAESVLVDGGRISGVLDWAQARVADPADDLSWLVVGLEASGVEGVLAAYTAARGEAVDADLVRRARLAGELAVARWLLHGVGVDDDEIVADAREMLVELEAAVADSPW
jgi:aminoglycoside phosphotransferase (APT) family kinase protein